MVKELPINSRLIKHLAKATVRNVIDGIVELITNSDDSYRRLEEKGKPVDGRILIKIKRKKGGFCEQIVVEDFAEGLNDKDILRAIEFACSTSGFQEGKSVRGFFGRGLKETIVALGVGEIVSVKDGKKYRTKIWVDERTGSPVYDDSLLKEPETTNEPNGTIIKIDVTNENARIPTFNNFKCQLVNHYALRDILSSENRTVLLNFEDSGRRQETFRNVQLYFSEPIGKLRLDKELKIKKFKEKIRLVVYESPEKLSSPRNDPSGLAGILIKTSSAILDNQLFRFENEPAALYFYGYALCFGIEERIRKGETGIIDPNRAGIEWRHEYSKALAETIEGAIEKLIIEKKKELEGNPSREVSESKKKMIAKICHKLNEFILQEEEIEEEEKLATQISSDELEICDFIIKPEVANLQIGKYRNFSVYARKEIVDEFGNKVFLKCESIGILLENRSISLEPHKEKKEIYYGNFRVLPVYSANNIEATILARLGYYKASARVRVQEPGKKARGQLSSSRKGYILGILPDETQDPPQRVSFNDGYIRIFINFPSVKSVIGSGFEGIDTPEGRILLAELVGEAFCKELARRGIELNRYPVIPGSEIDAYNRVVNELQKKYLHLIQAIILNSRIRD